MIAESDARLAKFPAPFKTAIDWAFFTQHRAFHANREYVRFVRDLVDCATKIVLGANGKKFKDQAISTVMKSNPKVASYLSGKTITLQFDLDNKTMWHPHRSKTLMPKKFLSVEHSVSYSFDLTSP